MNTRTPEVGECKVINLRGVNSGACCPWAGVFLGFAAAQGFFQSAQALAEGQACKVNGGIVCTN